MSQLMFAATQHSESVEVPAVTRKAKAKPKKLQTRVVIVADENQDLTWLGGFTAMRFEPLLMFSNFDAVQRMTEDLTLRMVLFAQHSPMMDGITACQLLRQSRSESDVAIMLLLDDNLDQSIPEAFGAGASDVICQPYFANELIARVDATWQRLQLWNDVESLEPLSAATDCSITLGDTERNQSRPHFKVSGSSLPSSATPEPEAVPHVREVPAAQRPTAPSASVIPEPAAPSQSALPTTTLLLADWLLTHDLPPGIKPPAFDLSQLKFVPTLPAPQAAAARQCGALSEVLLDRVWVCPQCRALPSFRPACPCCGSGGVERDHMLHHFACAFVGPTGEFQVGDEGLACPKCCTQRLLVGTDCEFLDGPWRCTDCDWSAAELEIVGHCLKCGFRFPAQQAVLEDLVGHHVSH
jgi:DNA-binding response OmpR family regulator